MQITKTMQEASIVGIIIIFITFLTSYQGLKDHAFLDRYAFQTDKILINKEYIRLVTSGFLHVSWMHFAFNMATLYFFSDSLEWKMGPEKLLAIYFGSLVGGGLFSLYMHRNHPDYRAIGASGAVSGLVFASIALFPDMELSLFLLPVFIPGWAFGLFYVLISIYGIRSQSDNIGHDAHLGGGLVGLIIAVGMFPESLTNNYLVILLIVIPSAIFIYLILTRPGFLLPPPPASKKARFYSLEERYNANKRGQEKELDQLLDKIRKKGMESLSKEERDRLERLSNRK